MRYFTALRKDGTTEQYPAYTVDEVDLSNVSRETLTLTKGKRTIVMSTAIATFDIETTTMKDGDSYRGFMYIWQFCIDGTVIYGNDWYDFILLLDIISEIVHSRLVIYIHNLGYEFQFMRQLLVEHYKDVEVFAPQSRKPLTVRAGNIEFRCSYKLSNMSLEKATLNELGCEYIKASGDLDYKIFRTKDTPLDDTEFSYCMNDVLSLWSYIKAKLNNDNDTLLTIPLTSTGYVRRDCRRACKKSKKYMALYRRQQMNEAIYSLEKDSARGGDTGANRFLAGEIIANVDSFDAASSHPFQLCTQKFPCTRFYKYGYTTYSEFKELLENKAVIFRAGFKNLRAKKDAINLYLPLAKSQGYSGKIRNCNGRIDTADNIVFTLTDIDWKIVKDSYTWDEIELSEIYYAKYDYLPPELTGVILKYFGDKCLFSEQRKESEDENINYLYAKSKNKLNGIFGMAYTDPVRELIEIDDTGIWSKIQPDIEEALHEFYRNQNNFLVYAWGVWTTAHSRKHLNRLIDICGDSSIYWDTDSDKCIHSMEIRQKVEAENEKIKALCDERHAYFDAPSGRRYYMGVYELETPEPYKLFKTLGAKKYAYVDSKGELHITISGVQKKSGAKELGSIENFSPGFIFTKSAGSTLYYNHEQWHKETIMGSDHWIGDNIGMVDSTYKLGVTDEYAGYLGLNLYGNEEI